MSERPQLPPGLSLVYLSGGHVAHLGEPEMRDTECRAVAKAGFRNLKADRGDSALLGTGSWNEEQHALSLPLCRRCFPDGPRRPKEAD